MGKDGDTSYPTTKAESGGLYGSSTTNASGTSYAPTDFEKGLVESSQKGITNNYNNLSNGIYDSPDFNKYKTDLRRQQANGFENIISRMTKGGLLGTSGATNLANQYGNTMAQQDSDLMDKFRSQLLQNLNTSAQMYALPYDMMKGTTGISQSLANSVANFNTNQQQLKNEENARLWAALGGAMSGGMSGAAKGYGGGGSKSSTSQDGGYDDYSKMSGSSGTFA